MAKGETMMKKHGRQRINGKAKRRLAALILAGLAAAPSFACAAEADSVFRVICGIGQKIK